MILVTTSFVVLGSDDELFGWRLCKPEDSMEQASINKFDAICRKLDLKPSDEVIEIGTGWGGFAMYAAEHYGCHVTTTTISEEQFAYADEEITRRGLKGRITLLKDDYRQLKGQYDKLVSIEMIEAVGLAIFPCFFKHVRDY